ncbi:unnamed protein product [Somion occarium]|uniref:NADAR domain-containing protein n=1 Tax=Somion occarium TaxID=3059160 RepID=A0ABP1CPB9_9APHY
MPYTYPSNDPEDYIFFWKVTDTHGWASQWYHSPFKARIQLRIDIHNSSSSSPDHGHGHSHDLPGDNEGPVVIESEDEILFPTAEHWMMACKALLFGDRDVFTQIIHTTHIPSTSYTTDRDSSQLPEPTLQKIKSLGRAIANFNEPLWFAARTQIVLHGNLHKFRQNSYLRRKLLETGERRLVEASPVDRIWGVGYGEGRALSMKGRDGGGWGLNLLGGVLMDVRRVLRGEEEAAAAAEDGLGRVYSGVY